MTKQEVQQAHRGLEAIHRTIAALPFAKNNITWKQLVVDIQAAVDKAGEYLDEHYAGYGLVDESGLEETREEE